VLDLLRLGAYTATACILGERWETVSMLSGLDH
jgi:hypothetical protein